MAPDTPVRAADPPVKAAAALAVISVVLAVVGLLSELGALLLPESLFQPGDAGGSMAFGALVLALALIGLLGMGAGLAQLVLSILVVVQGRGLLRRGAVVLLVAWALGGAAALARSFTVEGDLASLPTAAVTAASVLTVAGVAIELLRAVLMLAGAMILWRGLAEIRRGRMDPALM